MASGSDLGGGAGGRQREAKAAGVTSAGEGGLEEAWPCQVLGIAPAHLEAPRESILGQLFWGLSVGSPSCFHIITS